MQNILRRAAGAAVAFSFMCAASGIVHASPGCDALNGTYGPSFVATGSQTGTGFRAGDVISVTLLTGPNWVEIQDTTPFATLATNNTVGSTLTYTVPADTNHTLKVNTVAGPATSSSWSCVSAPDPTTGSNDSSKLRSLQQGGTRTGAMAAGSAYSSIIQDAIGAGIAHRGGTSVSPPGGVPAGASGLGMGEDRRMSGPQPSSRLTPWINGRFSESIDGGDVDWQHKTVAAGASYTLAPGLIVGGFGGYEKLDFDQDAIAGKLDGRGGTAGAYFGWMLDRKIRLDGAVAHTWLDYDATAGTASGDFAGRRWLGLARLSGDEASGRWTFTPSAEVFWLHETQGAYTDSLGTAQAKDSFTNGRADVGIQAAYAIPLSPSTVLAPYAGIYADYYFGMDDGGTAVSVLGIGDGWAARATGGLTLTGIEGWSLAFGAEAGNLGGEGSEFWTGRLGGAVRF